LHNSLIFSITFYVIALAVLGSGVLVVTLRNIVHAALALIACFFMVSWLYLLASADFLWVAQLLIYAGAIPVLIVFAIMFTRRSMSDTSNADTPYRPWAAVVAMAVMVLLLAVLLPTHWNETTWPGLTGTTSTIGLQLVKTYVVPFEVVSVLLLVGLIGAVTLAHREEEK
jgi:NADH:ubiquinone oxidoreductase subunit 6 (subunit J)